VRLALLVVEHELPRLDWDGFGTILRAFKGRSGVGGVGMGFCWN